MPPDEQGLEIDIDTRLADIWATVWAENGVLAPVMDDEVMLRAFASCLRAAYGVGYVHALREERAGRRAELALLYGYAIP